MDSSSIARHRTLMGYSRTGSQLAPNWLHELKALRTQRVFPVPVRPVRHQSKCHAIVVRYDSCLTLCFVAIYNRTLKPLPELRHNQLSCKLKRKQYELFCWLKRPPPHWCVSWKLGLLTSDSGHLLCWSHVAILLLPHAPVICVNSCHPVC